MAKFIVPVLFICTIFSTGALAYVFPLGTELAQAEKILIEETAKDHSCVILNTLPGLPYSKEIIKDGQIIATRLSNKEIRKYSGCQTASMEGDFSNYFIQKTNTKGSAPTDEQLAIDPGMLAYTLRTNTCIIVNMIPYAPNAKVIYSKGKLLGSNVSARGAHLIAWFEELPDSSPFDMGVICKRWTLVKAQDCVTRNICK